MLQVHELSFSYVPERVIFDRFSFAGERGERICLHGVSGCGKTTLLRLIAGLETPDAGTITLRQGCKTAMVFQEDRLLPWLTAKQNVSLCGDEETAGQWLDAFGLLDAADDYPAALSGGMCRRVALARACAVSPDLLLLDEAFKGIDPLRRETILALLQERFQNSLILFTSHDDAEIAAFATRVIELPRDEGQP